MLLKRPGLTYNLRATCKGMLWVLAVYTGLFLLAVIFAAVSRVETTFNVGTITTGGVTFGGAEGVFFIAFMIACMSDYTAEFHFMLQHSLSRRSAFIDYVLHIVLASAFVAALAYLGTTLFSFIGSLPAVQIDTQLIFPAVYSAWLEPRGALVGVLMTFLYSWTMLITAGVLGYLITTLFYRMGTVGKTIFWGVLIAGGVLLPVLNRLTGGWLWQFALWFGQTFLGRGDVPNPWNGMGVFLVLALLGLIPCWLLVRRCKLKKA